MKAIRGATTVDKDEYGQIQEAVKELLCEIKRVNSLGENNIICILFSNTGDLRSYYPAKAAREAGFFNAPLFSALEPNIEGSLKKCIRVMLLAETETEVKHVYLRGAAALRKDLSGNINIALDGPAGSGKSTVSKKIAEKLDILCLDTGAMYRACALKCLKENIDIKDEGAVKRVISEIDIKVQHKNGSQRTFLDGKDVSEEIRKNEISMLASTVSAVGCVREKMVELQREIAKNTSCILDGRDIGTNVLPYAPFKFYLTASAEVRAKRRYDELVARGQNVDYNALKNEIIARDNQDKSRKIAPLKQAEDSVFVDSSEMTIDEVVSLILSKIQGKI